MELKVTMAELTEDKKLAIELLCSRPDLTREKIAETVGISRMTLSRWQKEPTFRHEMRAMGREPIPPADVREILAVLIAQAKAKDVAAAKLLFAWQARVDGGPEPVDVGPPVINFIIKNDDGAVVDGEKTKALTGVVLAYLADPAVTRDGLLKELRCVLSEETLALLPAPEEAEELKTLPRAEPNIQRLLSPDQKSAGMEAARCRVETFTSPETGCVYIQEMGETEKAFRERVAKLDMFESMRQR